MKDNQVSEPQSCSGRLTEGPCRSKGSRTSWTMPSIVCGALRIVSTFADAHEQLLLLSLKISEPKVVRLVRPYPKTRQIHRRCQRLHKCQMSKGLRLKRRGSRTSTSV